MDMKKTYISPSNKVFEIRVRSAFMDFLSVGEEEEGNPEARRRSGSYSYDEEEEETDYYNWNADNFTGNNLYEHGW